MSEIWAGNIVVDGLPTDLEGAPSRFPHLGTPNPYANEVSDVHLWDTSEVTKTVIPSNATLRFLSNVRVPSIPLYLPIGPPLEVSTDNADTAAWLSDRLDVEGNRVPEALTNGSSERWWSDASRQLNIGVLLGVEGLHSERKVTEILLYAEVDRQQEAPLTSKCIPPSTQGEDASPCDSSVPQIVVKVCALPLCSNSLKHAQEASESLTASADLTVPRFLQDGQATNASIQKRQKISDLFDDATQQRRKLKSRGGEGILKAVSNTDSIVSQQGSAHVWSQGNAISRPADARKQLSKLSDAVLSPKAIETTPVSRRGHVHDKQPTLLHVESTLSPRQVSIPSDSDSACTLQNRAALTKMIMAGMRLHGLQQRKKKLSTSGKTISSHHDTPVLGTDSLNDGEDEYKLIYHQTFKAAMFTFRAHISERIIGENNMRDVVDRLLLLFCTEPIRTTDHQDGFLQAPQGGLQARSNAFDPPSSSAPTEAAVGGGWSTPPTKKRR